MEEDHHADRTLASAIASTTAIGFLASASYDIGYYSELNLRLTELPTTFSDHMRTCVNWLPQIFLLALGQIFWSVFVTRLEGGLTEEEIIASSTNQSRTRFFRQLPFRIWTYMSAALFIVGTIFYDYARLAMPVIYFNMWFIASSWCFNIDRMVQRFSRSTIYAIIFAPALLFFIWQTGKNEAYLAKQLHLSNTIFTFNDGTNFEARMLRSTENGFFVYSNSTNAVSYILSNSVKFVQQK